MTIIFRKFAPELVKLRLLWDLENGLVALSALWRQAL